MYNARDVKCGKIFSVMDTELNVTIYRVSLYCKHCMSISIYMLSNFFSEFLCEDLEENGKNSSRYKAEVLVKRILLVQQK